MALSDNLQGWWCPSLDTAGNGTTTLTDLSGNGNNGTLTNMDAATDWVADTDSGGVRALDFDGLDDYVDCGQVAFSNDFTLSAWVSTTSLTKRQMILAKNDDPHNEGDAWIALRNFTNNTAGVAVYAPNAKVVNVPYTSGWHLVTGVNDAGLLKIYIDGQLIDSVASGSPANSNDSLWIGAREYAGFNDHFLGRLDNLAVWDRALTAGEVSQLYNGGRSLKLVDLSTGLQGWWCPSLDTAGNGTTTLTDLSGNGNNGTLTNMDAATDWVADTDSGGVRAVSFDGSGAVVADGSVVTANQGTIALWVKPINWVRLYPSIVSNRNSGSNLIEVLRNSSNWNFRYGNVAAGVNFPGAVLGSWIHLAVSWDAINGIKRAWVNGVNLVDATGTWTPPTIDGNFVIGAADVPPNFGQGAESYQDNIAIYNRVLSSDEISQLYNGGRSLQLLATGSGNIAHVLRSIQQQHESVVVL